MLFRSPSGSSSVSVQRLSWECRCFFVLRDVGGNTAATLGMMVVMLPAFFLGMYQKKGHPAEKLLRYYVQAKFLRPKVRPYKTCNYYSILTKEVTFRDESSEKDR